MLKYSGKSPFSELNFEVFVQIHFEKADNRQQGFLMLCRFYLLQWTNLHCWWGCPVWIQISRRFQQSCEQTWDSPDPTAWTPPDYCHSPVGHLARVVKYKMNKKKNTFLWMSSLCANEYQGVAAQRPTSCFCFDGTWHSQTVLIEERKKKVISTHPLDLFQSSLSSLLTATGQNHSGSSFG